MVWNAAILTECKIFMNYQWSPIWLAGEQLLGLCASRGAASVHLRKVNLCLCEWILAFARVFLSMRVRTRAHFLMHESVCVFVRACVSVGPDIRRNNCVFNLLISRWWRIIRHDQKASLSFIRICTCQSSVALIYAQGEQCCCACVMC